jgi:hypothetical protein
VVVVGEDGGASGKGGGKHGGKAMARFAQCIGRAGLCHTNRIINTAQECCTSISFILLLLSIPGIRVASLLVVNRGCFNVERALGHVVGLVGRVRVDCFVIVLVVVGDS